jgi:uncharacterized protein (TIGR03792 family)
MIRKFVLFFAILVLFAGQALASDVVIEQLRLKVPESQVHTWLEAEQQTWQPWLEDQEGFLGRDIAWDPALEEGQLLIHWATRDQWKAIRADDVEAVQREFESVVNAALGRSATAESPFPLVLEAELLPLRLPG